MDIPEHDIIIVGAGNAATCAALSATENGASVLQLEISPEASRGGNSAFTGGAFRVVYHGFDDLAQLIPDINDNELQNVDVGTYTAEQYFDIIEILLGGVGADIDILQFVIIDVGDQLREVVK